MKRLWKFVFFGREVKITCILASRATVFMRLDGSIEKRQESPAGRSAQSIFLLS